MKLICDAGHEHPLQKYGSDGRAVYYKMTCVSDDLYAEVHAFDHHAVVESDPEWLESLI